MTVLDQPAPTAPPPAVALGPEPPVAHGLDGLFGRYWPELRHRVPARLRLVLAAVAVAATGAVVLPGTDAGVGLAVVLLAAIAVMTHPLRVTAGADDWALVGLGLLLVTTMVIRDADWAVGLCGLAAYAVVSAALSRSVSVAGLTAAAFSIPLAWLRGLPWLTRSVRGASGAGRAWPLLRTGILSLALVAVFGSLFASADAVFARWVDLVTAPVNGAAVGEAAIVFGLLLALTLGGAYVGVNPPNVERVALRPGRTVRRFEWVTPVVAVMGVFVIFLTAQLSALFGGHAYLQATTGLTYAEYVHQGFGQLTAATAIVLVVVAVTLRYAPRRRPADRYLANLLLGGLCGLALVVVASALHRLGVYEEAYGFTRLRLLVAVFEIWLGLVLLLVMTVGVWLRARWVPKAALLAGVVMIGGMTLAGPDTLIARHNVDRLATTGQVDLPYLSGLSDDAVPALDRLPEPYRSCALRRFDTRSADGLSWNLSRARAAAILQARPLDPETSRCDALDR